MAQHAQERRNVKPKRPARLIAAAEKNITVIRENVPVMALTGVAFGASYGHIAKLCGDYGPHGWVQYATAGCVDLLCIIGAEERQRDKRIGRPRKGAVSWPTLVLIAGIMVTLAANIATSDRHFLGYCVAAWPAGALLLAVSILERRTSHMTVPATFSTRAVARRRAQESGTGTALPAQAVPVPEQATSAAGTGGAVSDEASQPWTDEDLVAEARRQWQEHAAMGVRLSQSRFELALKKSPRGGAGRTRVIDALKVVRAEAEAAAQPDVPEASEAVG